jgi:pimeloyl-ACP methyl ester carboxylesterase
MKRIALLLLFGLAAVAQQRTGRPLPSQTPNASAPSHVINRGDLEILTFETEQNYDRLQELYAQAQRTEVEPGQITVRYLHSPTDGSVQPYAVRLPRGFDKARKYPLVVQLHGLNFKEVLSGARLNYRGMWMGESQWIQADLPVIYAQPFGRPSAFYQGMGEEDVLEVIEAVKQQFPVDPDRIFLMGHSMGGAGSYTVGLHHPNLFGGIMPLDPALWSVPEDAPKWMGPQIDIVSVPKLYPNARNVDVFFKNAGAGLQRNSTEFTDGIVAAGGFSTTESFPRMPHNFGDQYSYASFIPELIQHPVRRMPAEVKFYTNTLRYNRAYWVTIDRLGRHNADTSITAKNADGTVQVATTNIDAFTLNLGRQTARLVVDGREVSSGPLPDAVHLTKASGEWRIGEWPAGGLVKRHGLQGPIGDAFNSRFLAVYGEGDRDLAIAELDAIRNPPGPLDIHGDFPMKPASKVVREDVESSNLILFGTPGTNAVLKRIAGRLPAGLVKSGATFIYPNPENPARYVVVWTGKLLSVPEADVPHASWIMPLNLLPDYVQLRDGKIVSGGHFDSDWK